MVNYPSLLLSYKSMSVSKNLYQPTKNGSISDISKNDRVYRDKIVFLEPQQGKLFDIKEGSTKKSC